MVQSFGVPWLHARLLVMRGPSAEASARFPRAKRISSRVCVGIFGCQCAKREVPFRVPHFGAGKWVPHRRGNQNEVRFLAPKRGRFFDKKSHFGDKDVSFFVAAALRFRAAAGLLCERGVAGASILEKCNSHTFWARSLPKVCHRVAKSCERLRRNARQTFCWDDR